MQDTRQLHESETSQLTSHFTSVIERNDGETLEPVASNSVNLSGEQLPVSDKAEGSSLPSLTSLSAAVRPTSLDGVLKLLQDQQLIQQLGQQKFNQAKRAQNAWRRSAAAALKEQRSGSRTTDVEKPEPTFPNTAVDSRRRTKSMSMAQSPYKDIISSSPYQGANEVIEQFEKLAEDEKLRTLKKETLLKKRRNSLTLEKDVLKKKMSKQHEKKNTVKKFLGKDEITCVEDKQRVEERLQQVDQELATIERDLMDNKKNEAQVLDNINVMKTKTVRKLSLVSQPSGNMADQRREAYKSSHSESSSSQGSTEERPGKNSPKAQHSLETARKQSAAVSLAVLEKELRKISPVGGRKLTLSGSNINNNNYVNKDIRPGRVSVSSEGSAPDDFVRMDSPIINKKRSTEKRMSSGSDGSIGDQSSLPKASFSDSAELRRKRYSASGSQVAFHNVSVEIPTDEENKPEEGKHRLSVTSQKGLDEGMSRKSSVSSEKGSEGHRVTLMNALSQIKVPFCLIDTSYPFFENESQLIFVIYVGFVMNLKTCSPLWGVPVNGY